MNCIPHLSPQNKSGLQKRVRTLEKYAYLASRGREYYEAGKKAAVENKSITEVVEEQLKKDQKVTVIPEREEIVIETREVPKDLYELKNLVASSVGIGSLIGTNIATGQDITDLEFEIEGLIDSMPDEGIDPVDITLQDHKEALKRIIEDPKGFTKGMMSGVWEEIKSLKALLDPNTYWSLIKGVFGLLGQLGSLGWNTIKHGFDLLQSVFGNIAEIFGETWSTIKSKYDQALESADAHTTGSRLAKIAFQLIPYKALKVDDVGKYLGRLSEAISDGIKSFTASKKFQTVGGSFDNIPQKGEGIVQKITSKGGEFFGKTLTKLDDIKNAISTRDLRGAKVNGKVLVPKSQGWKKLRSDNGKGWKYVSPDGKSEIRFQIRGGNPEHPNFGKPYFRIFDNILEEYLDLNGNIVPDRSEVSHILVNSLELITK